MNEKINVHMYKSYSNGIFPFQPTVVPPIVTLHFIPHLLLVPIFITLTFLLPLLQCAVHRSKMHFFLIKCMLHFKVIGIEIQWSEHYGRLWEIGAEMCRNKAIQKYTQLKRCTLWLPICAISLFRFVVAKSNRRKDAILRLSSFRDFEAKSKRRRIVSFQLCHEIGKRRTDAKLCLFYFARNNEVYRYFAATNEMAQISHHSTCIIGHSRRSVQKCVGIRPYKNTLLKRCT